jgi:hypothetical protein
MADICKVFRPKVIIATVVLMALLPGTSCSHTKQKDINEDHLFEDDAEIVQLSELTPDQVVL